MSKPSNDIVKILRRERDEARRASAAKSDFLAKMSHEIRTPMNGIIGTASLLENTDLNETQRNYIQTIKDSGDSLLVILNEILDFSKLEAGELEIVIEPVEIYHCIDEIYHLFQAQFGKKEIKFKLSYNGLPEYILADRGRVRQVIINLLNNALKFTDEGLIELKITVIGKYIKFSIYDSGIGIPEEKQKHLFQAFSQVDNASIRRASGTGLGLNICKSLVELMNGEIGFTSVPNKGSCFWFKIPLAIPSDNEILEFFENTPKAEGKNVLNITYKAHILVADDVEINRFIASNMLKGFGCTVDIAENGKIAVEMAKSKKYDIIFTDFEMPVMDGIEATAEIRKNDKQIPIIGYTANILAEEKIKGEKAGMNDFILKPAVKENFAAILDKYISAQAHARTTIAKKEKTKAKDEKKEQKNRNSKYPLDLDMLTQFGDNKNKVVEMTISESDRLMEDLQTAINSKNHEDIGAHAHALRPVLGQIGAMHSAEIAKDIELRGKTNNIDEISKLFDSLVYEYGVLKKYLQNNL